MPSFRERRGATRASPCHAWRASWDAAVTELWELAGGRSDLLAEVAGVAEGFHRAGPGSGPL
jgi:hypothetical protein